MTYPLHTGERHQYFWSPSREAVAEHVYYDSVLGQRWHFTGWLWDGKVPTAAEAKRLLSEYLEAFPTAGE